MVFSLIVSHVQLHCKIAEIYVMMSSLWPNHPNLQHGPGDTIVSVHCSKVMHLDVSKSKYLTHSALSASAEQVLFVNRGFEWYSLLFSHTQSYWLWSKVSFLVNSWEKGFLKPSGSVYLPLQKSVWFTGAANGWTLPAAVLIKTGLVTDEVSAIANEPVRLTGRTPDTT